MAFMVYICELYLSSAHICRYVYPFRPVIVFRFSGCEKWIWIGANITRAYRGYTKLNIEGSITDIPHSLSFLQQLSVVFSVSRVSIGRDRSPCYVVSLFPHILPLMVLLWISLMTSEL